MIQALNQALLISTCLGKCMEDPIHVSTMLVSELLKNVDVK